MRIMGHSSLLTTQRYLHMIDAGASSVVMDRHNEKKIQIVKRA
jgi:site-specific recombinase XerD